MELADIKKTRKPGRTKMASLVVSTPSDDIPCILRLQYQREWINDSARLAFCVKAAQIGYSTATAAWAVTECVARPNHLVVMLSASERQAIELVRKAKTQVDELKAVEAQVGSGPMTGTDTLEHSLRFSNGARIIGIASNPATARGYTGDVVLDEFAHHQESRAIMTAIYRQVTLGHRLKALSTPNGQQGKFYEVAKALGLDSGVRPPKLPFTKVGWSAHWCDIYRAIECGMTDAAGKPLDPHKIREGCDEYTWAQEYLCSFLSDDTMWTKPEDYSACVHPEALVGAPRGSGLFGGFDVGRSQDLSVLWSLQVEGDVYWTKGVYVMRNTPTPDQIKQLRAFIPFFQRLAIDQSGMGLTIAETLQREFPGIVGGVTFTAPVKEVLAVNARKVMEERRIRLPEDVGCRADFTSVRRSVNKIGSVRFDASHDEKWGHADRWWSMCLALSAAEGAAKVSHMTDSFMPECRPITSGWFDKIL